MATFHDTNKTLIHQSPVSFKEHLAALKEADRLLHNTDDLFNESMSDLKYDLAKAACADADTADVMDMLMQNSFDLESQDEEFKMDVGCVLAYGMIAGLVLAKRHAGLLAGEVANG